MSDSTTRAIPPTPPLHTDVTLVVIAGPDAGLSIRVTGSLHVGSSRHADLELTDPTVSRRHLLVRPSAIGVRCVDQGSRNGTWLGSTLVRDVDLRPGGEIRLGETVLQVEQRVDVGERQTSSSDTPIRSFGRFLGSSDVLQPMYRTLDKLLEIDATVLLEGESGSGKELLAEAIHEKGSRADGPFVVVDSGALPSELIEAELLGYEVGAFTGATERRSGAFERADGGTIFLDEIGELPLGMQTRLLRVLDRGTIQRIGGAETLTVDVRVVAATNRNLEREVEEGRFRLDLFHRIAVVLVRVPPLRERGDDVVRLAQHFGRSLGNPEVLDDAARERLRRMSWPGNVRQLRNHVERLVLLGEAADLVAGGTDRESRSLHGIAKAGLPYRKARARLLELFSRDYTEDMLRRFDGNVTEAARAAGIARRYFQQLKES
jgi:two-component system nitrogen regulation response regulator GlnG